MNFESMLGTCRGGSKRLFLLLLLTFFLATGYQATVQADNLIAGTVSLPGGDVASAGGLRIDVEARDTISNKSYWAEAFIPEDAQSATYSVTVPSGASSRWEVSYYCPGCESYAYQGYYSSAGTTWDYWAATLLAGTEDHSGIDMTLLTGDQISGSVYLPGGDVAPAGGLWFKVSAWDTNSSRSYGYGDDFYIPEGDRSAAYSMTVPSDASAQWQVEYYCFVDACESYVVNGYYASSGTTWIIWSATLLTGSSDHSGIDMTLLTTDQISGSVSLPGGEVAPAGGLRIDLGTWDTISHYMDGVGFDIPEGETSATYSIKVPSDTSAQWQVAYNCFFAGCGSYVTTGYYATGGTTWDSSAATLLAGGSDHSEINLVIMKYIIDSCALAVETIPGPETYNGDFYCSAEESITAGGVLGAPSPVIVENGGYVVYSAPIIKLMPGFTVNGGIFKAGNSIR